MGLINMHYAEGQTPLDDDEKEGLLVPSNIYERRAG